MKKNVKIGLLIMLALSTYIFVLGLVPSGYTGSGPIGKQTKVPHWQTSNVIIGAFCLLATVCLSLDLIRGRKIRVEGDR